MTRNYTLFTGQWADLPFKKVAGMDRLKGAPEALAFLKQFNFAPSGTSFDSAFTQ